MNIFQPTNQIPMTKYEAQKKRRKIQKKTVTINRNHWKYSENTYIMYAYGSSDDEKKSINRFST